MGLGAESLDLGWTRRGNSTVSLLVKDVMVASSEWQWTLVDSGGERLVSTIKGQIQRRDKLQ